MKKLFFLFFLFTLFAGSAFGQSLAVSNLTVSGPIKLTSYTLPVASSDLDWNRSVYSVVLTVNTNFTFSNIAGDKAITLYVTNSGQFTIGFPSAIYWPLTVNNSVPLADSNSVSIFTFNKIGSSGFTNGFVVSKERAIKSYIFLQSFHNADSLARIPNTNDVTASTFMRPVFSNSADQLVNYVEWQLQVPDDFDTSSDPRAKINFKLTGADTGTQRYVLSMASVAASGAYAGTVGTAINLDFAGDASGASGDVEQVGYTTLTGWGAGVTAGSHWVIRLARDGDAAQDASTVDSMLGQLSIEYTTTR
jgi:hypothetical protein